MGRPKKSEQQIFPNGAHLGVVQLPIDIAPRPSAQRLVQWVNRNGELECYISENAYAKNELFYWWDRLFRMTYQTSIAKGSVALGPIKARIHWCLFTEDFCKTGRGERMNPETGFPEDEEGEVVDAKN